MQEAADDAPSTSIMPAASRNCTAWAAMPAASSAMRTVVTVKMCRAGIDSSP
jgi:hypothetical protein